MYVNTTKSGFSVNIISPLTVKKNYQTLPLRDHMLFCKPVVDSKKIFHSC